ncbi:MAG TPA: superoxide dismutase family protein [Burkholderiaceae bacterium]|nr:superoxide dismutase family protein [Burkholderiaceae bacterium]
MVEPRRRQARDELCRFIMVVTACSAALAGCTMFARTEDAPRATARLVPTSGNSVIGVVSFTQLADGVRIDADISGLAPNSEHGFHVHEKGDCSAPDGTSAGPHFNPDGAPHGMPEHAGHHAGDMLNLKSDGAGFAHYTWKTSALSIGGAKGNVVGRAVIIHRDPDDYASQPAGNSGPRLACGVIQLQAPES